MPAFRFSNPDGVRRAAQTYSHVAIIERGAPRVLVSGQVGLRLDGSVADDPAAQVEQTFENLGLVLRTNGLAFTDIVRQRVFLTDRNILPAYRAVRPRFMGDHAPVSTLLIVAGLTDPRLVIEIEVEAVAPAD